MILKDLQLRLARTENRIGNIRQHWLSMSNDLKRIATELKAINQDIHDGLDSLQGLSADDKIVEPAAESLVPDPPP